MSESDEPDRRMSGPNGGVRPVPDPTVLTNQAIERAIAAERERTDGQLAIRDQRVDGIDEATKLQRSSIAEIPTTIDEKVAHLTSLMEEKFASVATQFKERDTRSEREARDNKLAVDAAFAAQEKQAVAQNKANEDKIDKSEKGTTETIKTNQELSKSKTDELTKGLDELKLQVSRIEAGKQGASETRTESRAQISSQSALIGTVLAVIAAAGIYFGTREPAIVNPTPTPTPPTVTVTVPATP